MADIINVSALPGGIEEARRLLQHMDRGELIAQQLVQRGAINAIEFLIAHKTDPKVAQAMLESIGEWLMVIHETANARGIQLISYQAPEAPPGP